MAGVRSKYNTRSDWLNLRNNSPVMPMGQLKSAKEKPYNTQLINPERLVFIEKVSNLGLAVLTLLSFSQYGKILV